MTEPVARNVRDDGERFLPDAHARELMAAEHLARYAWAAPAAAGQVVLDAGCGVGYGTAMLVRAGAREAVGVDLSVEAVADAKQDFGNEAAFERGDLLALPFDSDRFTLVVCFEAIEHVADPERALAELDRVLAPGGALLLSSPNRGVYPAINPFHVHEYTASELEQALRRRFEHVRLHRQQMHLASLVVDDRGHLEADPEREVAASVRRLEAGAEGAETYTLAVAGDGQLPELANVAMLTGGHSLGSWFTPLSAWEKRARRAEAEAAALRFEVALAEYRADHARLKRKARKRRDRDMRERSGSG